MLWLLAEWTQCFTSKKYLSQPDCRGGPRYLSQWEYRLYRTRAVVNLNEEIANHRADERYEIIQILEELFDSLRPPMRQRLLTTPGLSVTWLDHAYRFMRDFKAVVPEVSSNRSCPALATTSSLIENAVANDLHFTEDLTEIVITGPTTGGKTIMLKNAGTSANYGPVRSSHPSGSR